tara:strand:+ start:632 stop:826 length:195 start_codon:yes stop_codon:yes gene_type:complete
LLLLFDDDDTTFAVVVGVVVAIIIVLSLSFFLSGVDDCVYNVQRIAPIIKAEEKSEPFFFIRNV